MFENKELAIFDLDETIGLIDVDWDIVAEELHKYFLEQGIDHDFANISFEVNKVYKQINAGDKLINEVNNLFLKHEMKNIDNFKPYPRTVEAIKSFKGKSLAVCSGNNTKTIKACLKVAGLESYFQFITGRDSVRFAKPDPEALFLVLKHFNISAGQAVFIGNSINDQQASKAAGIDYVDVTEL